MVAVIVPNEGFVSAPESHVVTDGIGDHPSSLTLFGLALRGDCPVALREPVEIARMTVLAWLADDEPKKCRR